MLTLAKIVLRVYKSVSEILTGFDIDCSGAAYDGEQVYTYVASDLRGLLVHC
jgi:hypothetical protein